MSQCCDGKREVSAKSLTAELCPQCGQQGRSVQLVTLKSLLTPEALRLLDPQAAYRFCRTQSCPVVYFADSSVFETTELSVPVFQKEPADSVPVCYCFGFTREKLQQEVIQTGQSTAQAEITRYVREGKCACELRNPQGTCCLGNVARVVAEAEGCLQRR